jgi:hypothetical protein
MEDAISIDISDRNVSHIVRLLHDLAFAGWIPKRFASGAKISKNHQLLELRTPHRSIRIRVSVYKVGGRGEAHRLHQQRIEITTTYASGLPRLRDWDDVVLGYDSIHDAYVGLDPRRLALGGTTHNASTSIDPASLTIATNVRVIVRPHETRSFGLEYQAFFRPKRLGEYLFNYGRIHDGEYRGDGLLSGPIRERSGNTEWAVSKNECRGSSLVLARGNAPAARKRSISPRLVESVENQDDGELRNTSPEDLERILKRCQEVGDSGEAFVYKSEVKRLHKAGRSDLAIKVDWVSQRAVGRGYDIKSFEVDGSSRFIEVKSTIRNSTTFFVSGSEWRVAAKLRQSYCIYRVVMALSAPSISRVVRDPTSAEKAKTILRVPDGWRITLL